MLARRTFLTCVLILGASSGADTEEAKTEAASVAAAHAALQAESRQPCEHALVMSTYNLKNEVSLDWRMAEFVSLNTYNEIKQTAGASAVIYGVPVGADYSDFRTRIEQYNRQYSQQLTFTQFLNVAWTGLDPQSGNAYRECLNNQIFNTPGLHAEVTGATATNISILFRFNIPGKLKTDIVWMGVPANLTKFFPKKKGQGDETLQIPRPSQQVAISGNGSGLTTGRLVLEPLPLSPPAIERPAYAANTYGIRWEAQKPKPEWMVTGRPPVTMNEGQLYIDMACVEADDGWSLIRSTVQISPGRVGKCGIARCPKNDKGESPQTNATDCEATPNDDRKICFVTPMSINNTGQGDQKCIFGWTINGRQVQKR